VNVILPQQQLMALSTTAMTVMKTLIFLVSGAYFRHYLLTSSSETVY